MEAVSEVFNKHSLRAIRTAMYSWFLKSLQTMYSGDTLQDIVDTLWVMPGAARKELCLEYVASGRGAHLYIWSALLLIFRSAIWHQLQLGSTSITSARIS